MNLAAWSWFNGLLAGFLVVLLASLLWTFRKQRRMTFALRESEERFRTIVQTANEGVWIIDAGGRTQYVNDRMARMLGYRPEEMMGRSALQFSFPKDRRFMKERIRSIVRGRPEQFDLRFRCKDGMELMTLACTSALKDGRGDYTGAVGMFADITDRHLTEHELQKSRAQLAQLNRELEARITARTEELRRKDQELHQGQKLKALGQLAAGVTHQLNNPLAVMLGFSQVLLKRTQPTDPSYDALKCIERETQRCTQLVRDLLSFSRLKGISFSLQNPGTVLKSALTLIETQAPMRNIELLCDIPQNLPEFEVESQQIQQLVINLCINAMDAMPSGGTLTVRAAARLALGTELGTHIEISVTDTGAGISEEVHQHLFEPFFTTKPSGKGTGLGLSMCYGIVKSHRGHIRVQSQAGKGSTFVVSLPLRAKPAETDASQAA